MPRWSSEPGRRHQAIGSGISAMLALGTYKRPLFGRVKELVVNPFELGDTPQMIVVDDPAVVVDAQLVTGEAAGGPVGTGRLAIRGGGGARAL